MKDAEDYRRRLAETMIHTEGNMKNYVSKIRKDLELALASIDALENLKAPIVPGYAYPAVDPEEEEASADAPAEEIPTEEVPDKAAPVEETPVEEPAEETAAPAEEPAADAEGTPIEEPALAVEEAALAEEKPEEEKETK